MSASSAPFTAYSYSNQLLERFLKDEVYLMRCASQYDWDNLVKRSFQIDEIFTTSVLEKHLKEHRLLQESAKRMLLQRDDYGNTVLHLVCFAGAPERVVRALLIAAAAANVNLTGLLKGDNSTALAVACSQGVVAPRVIQLLLHPPGNQLGADMVRVADMTGQDALLELCSAYLRHRTIPRHTNLSPSFLEADLLNSQDYSALFQLFWESANHLLQAAWSVGRRQSAYISVLQSACYIASSCSKDFSNMLCRCYPHMVAFPDRKGIWPLHLALMDQQQSSTTDSSWGFHHGKNAALERQSHFVVQLCKIYPPAVRIVCPESRRTPFCAAIFAGLPWELVLKELLQIEPQALFSRDLVTHLHPFLLAATVGDDVSTIYCLLRMHPQVLLVTALI